MSGRSRSLAATLFFEAQLLRMDEVPDRAVIDLKSALGEFGDEPAQGEVSLPGPLQQPDAVLARNRLRLVPAHLARPTAARPAQPPHPIDHRTDAHAKLGRRPAPRHPTLLNRRNHPLTQIKRIGSTHRMLASIPASILNQPRPDLGIPNRFRLKPSRFNADRSLSDSFSSGANITSAEKSAV